MSEKKSINANITIADGMVWCENEDSCTVCGLCSDKVKCSNICEVCFCTRCKNTCEDCREHWASGCDNWETRF